VRRTLRIIAVVLIALAAAGGLGTIGSASATAAGTTGLASHADSDRAIAGDGDDGLSNAELQRAARAAGRHSDEVPGQPMAWFGIIVALGIFVGIPMWLHRGRN
jgi:hypothetical protein